MIAVVSTAAGGFAVDLETEEVEPWDGGPRARAQPEPQPAAPRRRCGRGRDAWSRSSTRSRRCSSRTTPARRGASPVAGCRPAGRSRSRTTIRTSRLRGAQPALRHARRRRLLERARGRAAGDRARSSSEAELAARDDDGRAADENAVDPVALAVRLRVERRRAVDLGALRDLDLLAERDPPVPCEMDGERAGGGARSPGPRRRRGSGANMRVFQRGAVDGAKQLTPSLVARASAARSGRSAATSSGEPSST